jgi:pimeloyl-ACP methyl ester carboxylesterase
MTDFVTTPDGVRLAFDITGNGPPLLCLPGLTRNMSDFDTVVAAFSDRARIIRMDFRGRGASGRAEPATYQVPQEAADVLTLLDHLDLPQVTILGTSRGGLVALGLAVSAPERLSGVIFNDIGPDIMPEGLAYIMDYLGQPPRAKTFDEMAESLAAHYADAFQDVPPAQWLAFVQGNYRETGDGLELTYDARLREAVAPAFAPDAAAPDLWPFFDALAGKPIGLIRGANSNLLSAETAAEMQLRRPDMIYREVPKRGHVPFLDEPEAQAVITAVLEQVS